jgi:hypothetical protein
MHRVTAEPRCQRLNAWTSTGRRALRGWLGGAHCGLDPDKAAAEHRDVEAELALRHGDVRERRAAGENTIDCRGPQRMSPWLRWTLNVYSPLLVARAFSAGP